MKYAKVLVMICFLFTVINITQVTMADNINDFLMQENQLQQLLEVRDFQAGFVGISGQVWKVEPLGRWFAAQFVNTQIQEPYLSGQLTREHLKALARAFAEQDFTELPNRFGRDVEVNPRTLTIRFGVIEKSLILNAGENLETVTLEPSQLENLRRFRNLFQSIMTILQ